MPRANFSMPAKRFGGNCTVTVEPVVGVDPLVNPGNCDACVTPKGGISVCTIKWDPPDSGRLFEIEFNVTVPPQDYNAILFGKVLANLVTGVSVTYQDINGVPSYRLDGTDSGPVRTDRWPFTTNQFGGDYSFKLPFNFVNGRAAGTCGVCQETFTVQSEVVTQGPVPPAVPANVDMTVDGQGTYHSTGTNIFLMGPSSRSWIEGVRAEADACFLDGQLRLQLTLIHFAHTFREYGFNYVSAQGDELPSPPAPSITLQDGARVWTPQAYTKSLNSNFGDDATWIDHSGLADDDEGNVIPEIAIETQYSGIVTPIEYTSGTGDVVKTLNRDSVTAKHRRYFSSAGIGPPFNVPANTRIHNSINEYSTPFWPQLNMQMTATRKRWTP